MHGTERSAVKDGTGVVSFTLSFGMVPPGWVVTATATDTNGNTSAFSAEARGPGRPFPQHPLRSLGSDPERDYNSRARSGRQSPSGPWPTRIAQGALDGEETQQEAGARGDTTDLSRPSHPHRRHASAAAGHHAPGGSVRAVLWLSPTTGCSSSTSTSMPSRKKRSPLRSCRSGRRPGRSESRGSAVCCCDKPEKPVAAPASDLLP
jgi:hypothetical protein